MLSRTRLTLFLCLQLNFTCSPLLCDGQTAAVVGAGVHGLLAALELQQRGWNVTVYEKASDILPVVPTININGWNYDYYSQAIFSSASFESVGSNPALVRILEAFDQTLPQPWAASGLHKQLYYDTVRGPSPYPAVLAPFLQSPQGMKEVAQQLAKAIVLLREIGTNSSTPADFLESGLAESNESILQWAQRTDLPAYSGLADVWWYAAECLLPQPLSALVRLNMDATTIGGLLRMAFLTLGVTEAQAEELGVAQLVASDGMAPTAFQYLPDGMRGLFKAALEAEGLLQSIRFNTPVSAVTNAGTVTSQQGSLHFDAVIVTVRPEAAFAMLQPPLQQVYEGGLTGLVDTWVFNASIVPNAKLAANLSDVFLTTVSQNGSLPRRDGTPLFIIRQDASKPFYAVASYVDASISQARSLATATAVLSDFGLHVASTTAHDRIPFPSQLAQSAEIDQHESVYLLGEALAGVGLDVALPYVAAHMEDWFGPVPV